MSKFTARKMLAAEMAKYRSKQPHVFCVEHESGALAAVNLSWAEAVTKRDELNELELETA